jgi:hypothetical protein
MNCRGYCTAALFLLNLSSVAAYSDCVDKLAAVDDRLSGVNIESSQQAAVKQLRDQAADLCAKGADPTSMQLLGMLEMMIPSVIASPASPGSGNGPENSSKPWLSNEFLAGTWCSMTGQERASLVFSSAGTYKPCFPANEQGYVQCGPDRPTGEWLDSFVANESQDPNEMVLSTKRGVRMVFRRGQCSDHGR